MFLYTYTESKNALRDYLLMLLILTLLVSLVLNVAKRISPRAVNGSLPDLQYT